MSRIARAIALGFPHHVVQRGNNREKVFLNEEDKEKYLSLLRKYSGKWNSPILACCLMNNHVHLLTRPSKNESLYKMMQGIPFAIRNTSTGHTRGQAGYGRAGIIHA